MKKYHELSPKEKIVRGVLLGWGLGFLIPYIGGLAIVLFGHGFGNILIWLLSVAALVGFIIFLVGVGELIGSKFSRKRPE